jgi:predicted CXXCH cytochrome family protein
VDKFLAHGDPFVPGEDLALYSAPLWHDTTLREEAGVFEARFWGDGTARLTAYEYQGLLQSPCFQRGQLTCIDCHGMHEGDPRGQLREFASASHKDALCTNCHQRLATDTARIAHAGHGSTPPDCVSCHMPPIVYGVLSTHPSHRIELPDPGKAARDGRPDACTLCHTDRTRAWAVREWARLFGKNAGDVPPATAWSEVETQLLAGDPIERAIAAQALGRAKTRKDPRVAALLLEVMEHDDYPVVRRFAAQALAELRPDLRSKLAQFVAETPAQERARFVAGLRTSLPALPPLPEDTLTALRSQASARAIDIGE